MQALRDAATYLSRYGIYTSDIDRLLSLHFAQADNALPGGSPHSAIDAAAPGFRRAAGLGTVVRADDLPALRPRHPRPRLVPPVGPSACRAIAETNARPDPHAGRHAAVFEQLPSGSFVGSLLDPAQLTLQGGVFSLRETDGTVSRFDETTGRLLDVTDRNGHKVTLNYARQRNTRATAPFQRRPLRLRLQRRGTAHPAHRPGGAGDDVCLRCGRRTSDQRDRARRRLGIYLRNDRRRSRTSTRWTSVTRPDGTHVFYEYDGQGRLVRTSRDGGAEAVTLAYGSVGEVFLTDALNNTTSLFFNEIGQLLETRDALGRSARLDYDAVRRLDRVTLPQDTVSLYDFDDNGNLTFVVKPDGRSLSFTYDTTFNLPTTIRDERNIPLRYTYDAQGNLTASSTRTARWSSSRRTPTATSRNPSTAAARRSTIPTTTAASFSARTTPTARSRRSPMTTAATC